MKKKRILSLALAVTMLLGSAAVLPEGVFTNETGIVACAEIAGDYEYTVLKDGTVEIYKYNGNGGTVEIPSTIGGRKVTSIGVQAFHYCAMLTSVIIPDSVTSIGRESFYWCTSLTNVTIPSSVTNIGHDAFSGTKWLENKQKQNPLVIDNGIIIDGTKCSGKLNVPSGVKIIADFAFYNSSITSVTIPSSVTSIGNSSFWGCKNLTSVTMQKGVTSIGVSAFSYCENLTSVTISKGVTSIGNMAFYSCKSLTSVTIPSSVKSIGNYAFSSCTSLTSVTMPNGVTRIGFSAFDLCTSLKSVTIPSNITSIGDYIFYYCTSLTSVTMPNGVTRIDYSAFLYCENLKSVIIPKSVKKIGEYAFGYYENTKTMRAEKIAGFTVYGFKGTAAEKYAKKNGFKFVARSTTEPKVVRYAGSDRAETATKISKAVNAKTSDTVILATGFDFHDALAAVPLASAYNAPLLLADRDNLSAKTIAEIKRLKAKSVIVVASTNAKDQNGNDAAIKSNVYKQLKDLKVKVTKLDGKTYYETAKKVADQLKIKSKKAPSSVFITTDKNYADALSASPVAAILGAPILYVDPKAALNATTKNYLASVKKSVQNVYIVGGVNAVSKNVEKSVLSVLGKKSATRFAGDNRYDTCVLINKSFAKNLTGKSVCIAKGYNFPDALAGGVLAAKNKAPLFLADVIGGKSEISKAQSTYLKSKNPSKLYIFGGETAVPTALVKNVAKACV